MNKLKPCPFCGDDKIRILPQPKGWMSVDCTRCGATKSQVTRYKRQMVAEWNHRSQTDILLLRDKAQRLKLEAQADPKKIGRNALEWAAYEMAATFLEQARRF